MKIFWLIIFLIFLFFKNTKKYQIYSKIIQKLLENKYNIFLNILFFNNTQFKLQFLKNNKNNFTQKIINTLKSKKIIGSFLC